MRFIAPFKLATRMIGGMIGTLFAGMPGLLFAGAAMAGPFGFNLEDSRKPSEAYRFCEEINGVFFNFGCTTAPKPHPDMEYYHVGFVEGVGVCRVRGVGKDIRDSRWGDWIRSQVDKIANQVKLKYGSWSEKYDDIDAYSATWYNPEDWMMSILEDERYYGYLWELQKPRYGIKSIYVYAGARDVSTGYVDVQFETELQSSCKVTGADVF